MLRLLALVLFLCSISVTCRAQDVFRFDPPDKTQFVRTLTKTARFEVGGMMRVEKTILRAQFVFRQITSGIEVVVTPLSFRYVVNDEDVSSPVWEMVRGHALKMRFNAVGKLTEIRGYENIDEELEKGRTRASAVDFSMHLDRFPIGRAERDNWNQHILLWLDQKSLPGTHLEFDSRERGFTGEPINSHTVMEVRRAKKCGRASCVVTHYTMVPDLDAVRLHANSKSNNDYIGATASEELEQTIEPATMLPHYERVTWKSNLQAATPDGTMVQNASITIVSEFDYAASTSAHQEK